jgi:5-methylcytosine-specific restriction endonuclease McrA
MSAPDDAPPTQNSCPLCARPLGTLRVTSHHLVPRRYKGKETRLMHAICHRKIHATFTDRELRDRYHSFERLLEHDDIRTFVDWVRGKPPEFYAPTKASRRRR